MLPGTGSPRPASAAHSPSPQRHVKSTLLPFHRVLLLPLLLLLLLSSFLEPVSAQASELTLTFHDSTGAAIGEPQTVPITKCVGLNTASLVTQPPPTPPPPSETDPEAPVEEIPTPTATAVWYASVAASDPQSALNLYSDMFCQVLASSAVGLWKNEGAVANITSVRWEGTAPASMAPGTLNPGAFPQAMAVQTQVPGTEEAEQQWVMDPSKGRIVVGLVSAVMVIGVAIGIVQVYRASQYVAPPKKYKAVSTAVVGGKKVKKKDAYFKKPVRDSMMSSASAPAGVGPGFTSSAPTSPRSSRMMMEQSSRSPLMHERSRDSHFSVTSSSAPTLAPISSTGGYMDWGSGGGSGHSRRTNSHNNSDIHQNDSVLIDMQDSSSFRRPWNSGVGSSNSGGGGGQQSGSRQGTSSNGRISTSSTTLTDLMQFGHDSPAHSVYQSGSSSQLSSVHPRGLAYAQQQQQQQSHQQQQHHHHHHHHPPPPQHQQPPQQQQQQNQQYQYQYQQPGGRGSDVFVPMQQLEPRPSPPRR